MPELPEVETVRRGLAPVMVGSRFAKVTLRRRDLRFPFPDAFGERLTGSRVETLARRGKYMLAGLSSGETLILHLGMTGRFTVEGSARLAPGDFYDDSAPDPRHDHVVFEMAETGVSVIYNDPRRFGFMDLAETARLDRSRHFAGFGAEPLGEDFTAEAFSRALSGKAAAIKTLLLDQRIVAGIGNIYACEALFRAGVSPRRRGASVAGARAARLHASLRAVLEEAIAAGGSTLRDFAASDGTSGAFQQKFAVYGREGEPCARCAEPVRRLVQGARSTFYCARCQR